MSRVVCARLAALFMLLLPPAVGLAQAPRPIDLSHASIEDLMNIEITTVSRKEQRVGDVAAAVSILTQEDIVRSGMTTIPELLRLVPGVQVARINSNKWAVTVRGFNNLFADKVLVLIDGRTVYDRLNSGVFWESLDVPLDQIARIEVIRGPGGATWGANAVNGVINVVTMSAADLPGAAASVSVGTLDRASAAARYGGTIGGTAYRVYGQFAAHAESNLDADTGADDRWQSQTYGVRLDRESGRHTFMAEAGATFGSVRALYHPPPGPVPSERPVWDDWSYTQEYHALGRWQRRRDTGGSLQVQSFFDYRHNDDITNPTQILTDVEAQYHTALGRHHDLVTGAGYRLVHEDVTGSFAFSISPVQVTESVVNAFAQDEIALGTRVRLTLGAKVERDSYVGWGVQPTARVMWALAPQRQHVWAAVSRARHTPSLGDVSGRFNFGSFPGPDGLPVLVGALGNPALESEQYLDVEGGYRHEITSVASVDIVAFVGRYDQLKTSEPAAPRVEVSPLPVHLFVPSQYANLLDATASGLEIEAHWTPLPWWRLDGGFSTYRLRPHPDPESRDTAAASIDGNVPRVQGQARSGFFFRRFEVDTTLLYTGAIDSLAIDGYTRLDVRGEVPLTDRLALSVVGRNLLDDVHAEYAGRGAIVTPTLIPRALLVALTWKARP